jgi:CheY-like chemotaxis protein
VGVSVRDEGTGIPADVLTRMFEPFFTTKDAGRGTGLGLATTFGIVKQHRGFIDVETELGRWSTFRVYLPAREGADEPEAPRQARRGGSETILLAEDEAPVRIVLTRVLERRGYRVIAAATGVEALALFAEHKDAVALLLTDLVMPAGLGGKELAERILAERPGLKVVYMSGYSAEIAGRELALLPTERFVQKPVRPDELLGAIRASLDGGAS